MDEQTEWVRVQDRVTKFTILQKTKREKSKVKTMDFCNVDLNDLGELVGKNPWESLQEKRSYRGVTVLPRNYNNIISTSYPNKEKRMRTAGF